MNNIITLTVNPAVDKSTKVKGIRPTSKLRCKRPTYEAGGGGINVSRVIKELGGESKCFFLAGGSTGGHLKILLEKQGIEHQAIPIQGWTRENLSVTDTTNNQQYRFGMPGPQVHEKEWKVLLEKVKNTVSKGDFFIASGSLSSGIPFDFYARLSSIVSNVNAKFVLDTSGEALKQAAEQGAYLIKPNLGELAILCGVSSISVMNLETTVQHCLEKYPIEILLVSLGAKGALIAYENKILQLPAPTVHHQSTIGAGDSMVAGMVYGLYTKKSIADATRLGIACGTAATMTQGTELCKRKDLEELYKCMKPKEPKEPKEPKIKLISD
ncbi:1-phosphofructokinase family hexose kinase [uncultured Croceitalea sp.]|uniref:1-phosphofructokinase family hexose kinase n=1 Tax=uncultured Croceitalea sp. TaxID=1798908 RepID=UPI00374ED404